jgi:hypothetical protein
MGCRHMLCSPLLHSNCYVTDSALLPHHNYNLGLRGALLFPSNQEPVKLQVQHQQRTRAAIPSDHHPKEQSLCKHLDGVVAGLLTNGGCVLELAT